MEKLSPKCLMIMLLALACLVTGIAVAPAGPDLPFSAEGERQSDRGDGSGRERHREMNCSGGDSVYCHRRGNQAGL